MLDFERILTICNTLGVRYEEFMLLYSLHVRHQNRTPHLHPLVNEYYSKNESVDWIQMIESLEERELLVVLKRDKNTRKILVKNLQIADKFVSLLFADPDETWQKFVLRYPPTGLTPGGAGYFVANMIKDGDKEFFNSDIYKNATPEGADEIIQKLENMFGWDGEKTTEYASVSISRFLRNWTTYIREHQDEEDATSFRKRL